METSIKSVGGSQANSAVRVQKILAEGIQDDQTQSMPFSKILDDAMEQSTKSDDISKSQQATQQALNAVTSGISRGPNPNDVSRLVAQLLPPDERKRREDQAESYELAQVPGGNPDQVFQSARLNSTPFQVFMDKAVETLNSIGKAESETNDLIERFVKGEVSIDEVAISASNLNLMVSFATTVMSSATQAFKEIQQLQV